MADQFKFLRDVRDHRMTIEMDQGVHRSILFKRKGTFACHFRLNTWLGHLSITGDMGDYVFSRTSDMFGFFRDPDMTNSINTSYWHEKMRAQDKSSPARQFCEKKYRDAIRESADDWQVRLGDAEKIRSEIDDHLRWNEVGDTSSAYAAIRDFEASDGNRFEDFEHICARPIHTASSRQRSSPTISM